MSEPLILDHTSAQLDTNHKINVILKPHQKTSLYRANLLETSEKIDITYQDDKYYFNVTFAALCDNVGSGKSLVILSLIANNKLLNAQNKVISLSSSDSINLFKINSVQQDNYLKTNVLVVPHNLISQWNMYIERDSKLKFLSISKTNDLQKYIYDDENYLTKFELYDLILVSSTRYNEFAYNIDRANKFVSRLIFDEADSIKIAGCNHLKNQFTWLVTSSLKTILNPNGIVKYANQDGETQSWYSWSTGFTTRIHESGMKHRGYIKDLALNLGSNFISKNQLLIMNDLEFIKNSFNLKNPNINSIICKDPPIMNILNNIISNQMMEFINAGDIDGAINSMNCQKVTDGNLISLVTEDLEKELHNNKIDLDAKRNQIYSSDKIKKESILKVEQKIQYITNKINQIKSKLEASETCPVCYDDIENIALCSSCKTKFCVECITTWISSGNSLEHGNGKCPYCREKLTNETLIVVSNKNEITKDKNKLKDKVENLKKIIFKRIAEKSKILVFSNHDGTFTKIKSLFDSTKVSYAKIMGSSTRISNVVDRFNKDFDDPLSINILLLNSQYFGSGLNLQKATDIVLFHHMNKDITKQVVGRAQRPGRNSQLNIWRLCYSNEINEDFTF